MSSQPKQEAIEKLNQALSECRKVGVSIGVSKMYNSRATWSIMLGEDVEYGPYGFYFPLRGNAEEIQEV